MSAAPRAGMPLRIGVDLRRMHNTGIGRYARNIYSAVVAEAPQHRFTAVVQSEADAAAVRDAAPGTAECVVLPAAQYTAREMLRVPPLDLDLWHCPHPFQLGLGARHPVVLTLLDLIQVQNAIGLRNQVLRPPIAAFIWAACRRADAFVSISELTRDLFHRHMHVPHDRITVTRLAPDPVFDVPAEAADVARARVRWGLPRRTILYVGMSQPHKNLDRLLQALARLLPSHGGYASLGLAIIGPAHPFERAALDRRIESLGIGAHVHFLGRISDEDVKLAYQAADVLVQPSLVEGFGLTVLEAMRLGTACVASDIPAFREVTGGQAILVNPHDVDAIAAGIRRVLDEPGLAERLRAGGRAHAASFSWRRAAQETLVAYERAVQDPRSSSRRRRTA